MHNNAALDQYKSVDVQSRVAAANSHSLVTILLDGVMRRLAFAAGAMGRGDIPGQGVSISAGIRIIDSLRASLDYEKGGELAGNLGSLYDYIERRLLEANRKCDTKIISEVNSLLGEIKSGWDAIPSEMRG